jgi:glycosyltransferase involved in cell wall biosynthesis
MIRFSVITIVRNDVAGIMRTLRSVLAQTYGCFEFIVQDGASTDGTSDFLQSHARRIDSLVIEQDEGIYDAMNRALRRATGDYCIFMNAADIFVNNHVLEQVARMIDPQHDDILSGLAINDESGTIHKYRPPDQFWAGSTLDHQATFIRTCLMKDLGYDTRYKISGDLHFFTRARKLGARFRYEDIEIARKPFATGASSDFLSRLKDRMSMLEDVWGDTYPVRDILTQELRINVGSLYNIKLNLIENMSLEELLAERERLQRLAL